MARFFFGTRFLPVLALACLVALSGAPASAQSAAAPASPAAAPAPRPNDVAILVDVSGSMRDGGALARVKAYLKTEIVEKMLRPGDRAVLIAFGAAAKEVYKADIAAEADKAELSKRIDALQATDGFTDLGTALEALDAAVAPRADGSYRPVAVFVTDGKNAPPPGSPYSGKDLSLDDRFKAAGTRVAEKGWNLYVVGLGERTDAPAVAAAVQGSTLAPAAEPLKAEPLQAYAEKSAAETETRAAAQLPAPEKGLPWGLILSVAGGAAAGVLALVLFFVVKGRSKKAR